VTLRTAIEPDIRKEVGPFQVIAYDIHEGATASF